MTHLRVRRPHKSRARSMPSEHGAGEEEPRIKLCPAHSGVSAINGRAHDDPLGQVRANIWHLDNPAQTQPSLPRLEVPCEPQWCGCAVASEPSASGVPHRHACECKPRKGVASRAPAAAIVSNSLKSASLTNWCNSLVRGPLEPLREFGSGTNPPNDARMPREQVVLALPSPCKAPAAVWTCANRTNMPSSSSSSSSNEQHLVACRGLEDQHGP